MRNAQRSNAIRGESDPSKVAAQLESILFEAINVQNAGDKEFQIRALKELKQLRSDMVTGQINAGAKGYKYVGLYSHVIDQLDELTQSTTRTNGVLAKTASSFADSLPSTDSLIAALMTANPIVGYGAKIIRDIAKSRKDAVAQKRKEASQKLAVLKNEEKFIKEQLEQSEAESEVVDEQKKQIKREKTESRRGGLYTPLLTEIRDKIKKLEDYLIDTEGQMKESNDEILSNLEAVNDSIIDQTEALHDIERENDRDEKLKRMNTEDDQSIPVIDTLASNTSNTSNDKKGGMFGSILEGVLGMPLRFLTGAVTGFMAILTGLAGITGLAGAGGLVGMILTPAAVIAAIYGFFDGFFNADKIIGKMDSEISLGERVIAAFSNVFATFAKIIDWAANLFGFDLFDSEGIEKKIYEFVAGIPDKIGALLDYGKQVFDSFIDQMFGAYDSMKNGMISLYDEMITKASNVIDEAINSALSVFDKIANTFKSVFEGMEAKIRDWGQSLSNIPGIGGLFKVEDDQVKVDDATLNKAATDMKDMTSSMNLLRIGDGTATMIPLATNSQSNGTMMQYAERFAAQKQAVNQNTVVSAPTSVNNSNTTVSAGSNTGNQNNIYRRMNDMAFTGR